MQKYEQQLLEGWEDIYKRGQLTLWIMLALKDGPKHMQAIKKFIEEATDSSLSADDKSMYRALRRYTQAELIDFAVQSNDAGPDRKLYSLTPTGEQVLKTFLVRNVHIFYKPSVQKLIQKAGE